MKLNVGSEGVVIAAEDLAPLLGITPADVPTLMRQGDITSIFETGTEQDEGRFRITFRHKGTRVRLTCASDGTVLSRIRTGSDT